MNIYEGNENNYDELIQLLTIIGIEKNETGLEEIVIPSSLKKTDSNICTNVYH